MVITPWFDQGVIEAWEHDNAGGRQPYLRNFQDVILTVDRWACWCAPSVHFWPD